MAKNELVLANTQKEFNTLIKADDKHREAKKMSPQNTQRIEINKEKTPRKKKLRLTQ
jgi:hypothetical protein